MSISEAALDVLERSTCEGTLVRLPPARLERKLYEEVNEVLSRLGGKWKSGKTQAHVFDEDPAPLLATVVDTGEMPPKDPLAFFATPAVVVDRMLALAGDTAENAGTALEPSAGDGAIVRRLLESIPTESVLDVVEVDPRRTARLRSLSLANGGRFYVREGDFLTYDPMLTYDLILMNPPFTSPTDPLAYIAHIRRAHSMLAPQGELVSVAPSGFTFRTDRRSATFRDFVEEHGWWEECEDGAFKESGTGTRCVLVHLRAGT